jgi:hypothetical protein
VFTRSPSGVWSQQGPKLVGTGALGQGASASLSGDGNIAIVGGPSDDGAASGPGAAWVFTRSGTRGVRAHPRRMAGCATPNRSAGHAPAGATADHPKLTFESDHPAGADQVRMPQRRCHAAGSSPVMPPIGPRAGGRLIYKQRARPQRGATWPGSVSSAPAPEISTKN